MKRTLLTLICLLSGFGLIHGALAQEYPEGPITLVVANPPGGSSDINARILAEPWSKVLKQPIVVANKPGLGGEIGTSIVAKTKPDGYTLLLALSAIVVAPEAERVSGKRPLYEVNQFEPIGLVSSDPMVLIVRSDAPWKNLGDLVRAAKESPGTIFYSSSGNFGPIQLSIELFAYQAGVKFAQVPFGGGSPAVLALLGNQVQFTTAAPAVAAQQIASGKVRALAVSGNKRLASLPDVPTYKEAGYDAEFNIWAGVYAPAGTPKPVIETLRSSLKKAVHSPDYIKAMDAQGILMDYRDAPEFKKFADEDGKRLQGIIRAIGKIE